MSPVNACASIFELDASEDDINMWPEDSSQLRGDCDDLSTRLVFDSDCSQQFDGLVIDRESCTYSFNGEVCCAFETGLLELVHVELCFA